MYYEFSSACPTYIDEFDSILLDGVQGDGDVLDLVVLVVGLLVVAPQLPLLEFLHQGHQDCPVPGKKQQTRLTGLEKGLSRVYTVYPQRNRIWVCS